jgi:TolB protein
MKISKALLILLIAFMSPAQAALDLELTKGVNAAIPIAIAPFASPELRVPGNQAFSEVISNDLKNSGQFRVKTGSQDPHNTQQVDFDYWRNQGVSNLVVGSIQSTGANRYKIHFELIDIYSGSKVSNSAGSVLLQNEVDVSEADSRKLAHHISDLIYEKLTGVKGIFSTHIAYVLVQRVIHQPSVYTLTVADADAFNPRPLLRSYEPIMSPTWSPDASKIAYVSFENHRAGIYLQTVATGSRSVVSRAPGINGAPAFSPDGRKLAVVLSTSGTAKIYTMSLSGGQLTQITNGYSIDTEPNWAPDGQSIIFTSNRGGNPQIYRYYLSSHQISRVTYQGDYNAKASFFPNGQDIIFMHRNAGLFTIARQNLSTAQLRMLTQAGHDESPSLAPNGKMAIYATEYGGRGVLALVSTDGNIKLRLPASEGSVQEPAWSPK